MNNQKHEIMKTIGRSITPQSLPLRKCGLKLMRPKHHHPKIRHFPCGSVDWNRTAEHYAECRKVTSLAEVWIEITKITKFSPKGLASLPLRKCGLKSGCLIFCFSLVCHFPCGSVDWNLQWKPVNSCTGASHTIMLYFPSKYLTCLSNNLWSAVSPGRNTSVVVSKLRILDQ